MNTKKHKESRPSSLLLIECASCSLTADGVSSQINSYYYMFPSCCRETKSTQVHHPPQDHFPEPLRLLLLCKLLRPLPIGSSLYLSARLASESWRAKHPAPSPVDLCFCIAIFLRKAFPPSPLTLRLCGLDSSGVEASVEVEGTRCPADTRVILRAAQTYGSTSELSSSA